MPRPLAFLALALALLAVPAFGSDSSSGTNLVPNNHGGYNVAQPNAPGFGSDNTPAGTSLVPNNHGGYNTVQPGAGPIAIPFFGSQGFASKVIAQSHAKKNFVMVAIIVDDGHGKHTVYKRVYYATPEEAEAAKAKL